MVDSKRKQTVEERLKSKKESDRRYRQRNKVTPEKKASYDKKYRETHKSELKAKSQRPEVAARNRERARKYSRERYNTDPEFRKRHLEYTKAVRTRYTKELQELAAAWALEDRECKHCKRLLAHTEFQGSRSIVCKDCRPVKKKEQEDKFHKRNPQAARAYMLWKRYKMLPEDYDYIVSLQGGLCTFCDKAPKDDKLCVDHCHFSGQIRGLLCRSCNGALGKLEPFLPKVLEYLFAAEDKLADQTVKGEDDLRTE